MWMRHRKALSKGLVRGNARADIYKTETYGFLKPVQGMWYLHLRKEREENSLKTKRFQLLAVNSFLYVLCVVRRGSCIEGA